MTRSEASRRALLAGIGAAAAAGAAAQAQPAPSPPLDSLVGKLLRVLGPGDVGDMMVNENRLTIHVDANRRITHIRVG